jgi:predicted DNA-binding ribbon-helix-helix protein
MLANDSDNIRGDADLECRNVLIAGHRTSIRMEGVFWQALTTISQREGVTIEDLLARVDELRGPANRTAAIRVLVAVYARMTCFAEDGDVPANECKPPRQILDAVIARILKSREAAPAKTGTTSDEPTN